MFISSIRVRGFRDLPAFEATDLKRVVRLVGPSLATAALGDAVELAFAALSQDGLRRLLTRWELCAPGETPELVGEVFPEQASWMDGTAARGLVGADRALRVTLTLALDPPLFGQLRQHATRDPQLAAALASGAHLRLDVGALFVSTFDAVAITLHQVGLGELVFGDEARSRWVDRLLVQLGGRFSRFDASAPVAERALAALTSREDHAAYLAWSTALGSPQLRAISGPGGRAQVLADERPLWRWGRPVQERARLQAAIHLSGADIVWVESALEDADQAVDGAGSALEQVWRVCEDGNLYVITEDPDLPATLSIRRALRETLPS